MKDKKELSNISINKEGKLEVSTSMGTGIIVGFTSTIFGNSFVVEVENQD